MARVVTLSKENLGNGDFKVIPSGTKLKVSIYEAEEVAVKSGPNQGKPQMLYTVKVTEPGEYFGREIRYNYMPLYDAKNGWVTEALGSALGLPSVTHDDGSVSHEFPEDLTELQGLEFTAKIGVQRQDDGREFNRITGYDKANPGVGIPDAPAPGITFGNL